MLVGNFNGITDREVRHAVRWGDVHADYGCEPCRGKCQEEIADANGDQQAVLPREQVPFFGAGALAAAN